MRDSTSCGDGKCSSDLGGTRSTCADCACATGTCFSSACCDPWPIATGRNVAPTGVGAPAGRATPTRRAAWAAAWPTSSAATAPATPARTAATARGTASATAPSAAPPRGSAARPIARERLAETTGAAALVEPAMGTPSATPRGRACSKSRAATASAKGRAAKRAATARATANATPGSPAPANLLQATVQRQDLRGRRLRRGVR